MPVSYSSVCEQLQPRQVIGSTENHVAKVVSGLGPDHICHWWLISSAQVIRNRTTASSICDTSHERHFHREMSKQEKEARIQWPYLPPNIPTTQFWDEWVWPQTECNLFILWPTKLQTPKPSGLKWWSWIQHMALRVDNLGGSFGLSSLVHQLSVAEYGKPHSGVAGTSTGLIADQVLCLPSPGHVITAVAGWWEEKKPVGPLGSPGWSWHSLPSSILPAQIAYLQEQRNRLHVFMGGAQSHIAKAWERGRNN